MMIESEIQRVLENPDHVIMSEELELSLGNEAVAEYLELDNNLLICEVLSAKRNSKTSWKFQLKVPGLTFQDFASFEKATFQYGDFYFLLTDNFEFVNDVDRIICADAVRIVKENE